jgi:hypothetical protein
MAKYTLLVNKNTQARSVRNNKTGEVIQESIDPVKYNELRKKALTNLRQAQRNEIMSSMGLTKVYGAVSGKVYWE